MRVGAWLAGGGLLIAAGGQLHPIGEGDTMAAAFASMTGDQLWTISHVLLLAGLVVALVGLVPAYRDRTLGPGSTCRSGSRSWATRSVPWRWCRTCWRRGTTTSSRPGRSRRSSASTSCSRRS